MCSGERPAADSCVEGETGRAHRLNDGGALHVAKLTPVEVAACVRSLRPAEVDVAGALHHPLSLHHTLAVLLEPALRQVALQHRRCRLLDLQEQGIAIVAALEKDDERTGAHTADTDDLAGQVDDLEPLQQPAPVVLESGA